MQDYKKLKVWEKAHECTLRVYEATKTYPKEEVYSLSNQLRRAASAIPANIAEGCGKSTQLDFERFLNIALGSANESEYYLLLSKDLGYLRVEDIEILTRSINEIIGMLISLIGKVRPSL